MIKNQKIHVSIDFNFTEKWWHNQYGFIFDEKHFDDPDYQIEREMRIDKALYDRFGDLGIGNPAPEPEPVVQGYSLPTLPALLGCQIFFKVDEDPWAVPANLSDKEILKLEVPSDLSSKYPMNKIISKAEYVKAKYGKVQVGINWQSVLNIALKVRGEQLFIDFYDNPKIAHHILNVSSQTILKAIRFLEKRYERPEPDKTRQIVSYGGPLNKYCNNSNKNGCYMTANCTEAMISNSIYINYILPYDNYLAEQFGNFGIHHCGKLHETLLGYAKVKNVKRVEAGWGSSIKEVRKYFPKVWLIARLSPVKMEYGRPEEIKADVIKFLEEGKPLDQLSIEVYGLGPKTPDENIRIVYETVWEYLA